MASTKQSIAEKGQKYPVIVRRIKENNPLFKSAWGQTHYELADGERRVRCLRELGSKTVKAIIRDLDEWEMLDYGMTTNDSVPLNPIERAKVFNRLSKEFEKSQEEIAKSYNLKQQQVSEFIRLLDFPADIQEMTARAVITMRHAREILKVSDPVIQRELCKEIIETGMSTRSLTEKVRKLQENHKNIQGISKIEAENQFINEEKEADENKSQDFLANQPQEWPTIAPRAILYKSPGKSIYSPIIDALAQLNALFLSTSMKNWLKSYIKSKPALHEMRPEVYVSWCELSLVIPTLLIFVLYVYFPLVAVFFSSLCAVLLMMKLFEENPPNS
jgi:ParB/RepB/Spo0J family partition protein